MKSRGRSSRHRGGLSGKRILVIVTGGISAYKTVFLVRLLKRGGADVRVVMSEAAARFVTPLTFEVLSGNSVAVDLFAAHGQPGALHIELAEWAERVVVAPATAGFLAKAALGLADDLASTALLAVRCPVLFAPAMNEWMWENPAVQRNMRVLREHGLKFMEPGAGELACGDSGRGRMAEPEEIARAIEASFAPGDLDGLKVLVTAGRTEESIDPVRYISNRSSGRMGFAAAAEAKARGARVTLVHGTVDVPVPVVDSVKRVRTAAEMKSAVTGAFPRCDILIMAAAVADYTPVGRSRSKIKRGGASLSIELRPAVDILAHLKGKKREGQIVVGFALETEDAERNALKKVKDKGCDYMVLNTVGEDTGFSTETNRITLFKGNRKLVSTALISKEEAARLIVDKIFKDKRLKKR